MKSFPAHLKALVTWHTWPNFRYIFTCCFCSSRHLFSKVAKGVLVDLDLILPVVLYRTITKTHFTPDVFTQCVHTAVFTVSMTRVNISVQSPLTSKIFFISNLTSLMIPQLTCLDIVSEHNPPYESPYMHILINITGLAVCRIILIQHPKQDLPG